jgi:hypothetical protein
MAPTRKGARSWLPMETPSGLSWANGVTLTQAAPGAYSLIPLVDTPRILRYTRGARLEDDQRFEPPVQVLA